MQCHQPHSPATSPCTSIFLKKRLTNSVFTDQLERMLLNKTLPWFSE
jgi:hypothetical protein